LPELDAADSHVPRPSVFLSYASEDREAARLLRDALPEFGLEVWHDESELGGGEAWDQKIRRQIRECDYFMPLVSAQTQARLEGYFRREWRFAVERTLDMADDHLFLLPIVIDDTDQSVARVPEKFLTVQWLKVPAGQPTPALESLCRRLASGNLTDPAPARTALPRDTALPREGKIKSTAAVRQPPEFPREEPGQRKRFWVEVAVWAVRSVWVYFMRLPRWVRIVAYVWVALAVLSYSHSSKHEDEDDISPAKIAKLKTISEKYQGSLNKNDILNLGAQIAREFSDDSHEASPDGGPLLAIPFSAPAGDKAAEKFADSTFAMAYGMVSISHHGQVSLTKDPLPSRELGAALERGRASHSTYVLVGAVDTVDGAQVLTVKIAAVADGSVVWSKSYPIAGADPTKIASEVETNIPPLAGAG
jgi:TolB-like protein